MKIELHHQSKIASVWLTRAEKEDPAVKARLDGLYADLKKKKYTVAVFFSGDRDLCQETGSLLVYNRRRIAQLEGRGM